MDTLPQNKIERINIRLESRAKSLIERAAGFEGKTVSHFMLTSALERAERTVQRHESITLNGEYSRRFLEALSEPVRFNSNLTQALEEHERRVISK